MYGVEGIQDTWISVVRRRAVAAPSVNAVKRAWSVLHGIQKPTQPLQSEQPSCGLVKLHSYSSSSPHNALHSLLVIKYC